MEPSLHSGTTTSGLWFIKFVDSVVHAYNYYLCTIGITVRFDNAMYNVDEHDGIVQPYLIFSNPSSFVEIVQVNNIDITATGKLYFVGYHG